MYIYSSQEHGTETLGLLKHGWLLVAKQAFGPIWPNGFILTGLFFNISPSDVAEVESEAKSMK